MFCKNCGNEIDDKAFCCPKCGVLTRDNNTAVTAGNVNDKPSTGFAVLGFFIPLVGLILWLLWKDTTPLKAKSCGKGALIGVIVSVVFWIIYVIIVAIAAAALF